MPEVKLNFDLKESERKALNETLSACAKKDRVLKQVYDLAGQQCRIVSKPIPKEQWLALAEACANALSSTQKYTPGCVERAVETTFQPSMTNYTCKAKNEASGASEEEAKS